MPTNGSAIVLKTKAENGLSSSIFMKTSSSLLKLIAFCGSECSGDGKHLIILLIIDLIPIIFIALPHKTGAISPLAQPFINPLYISSSHNSPSFKYLSNSSSSVSATASITICLHSSTLSFKSSGISEVSIFEVLALYTNAVFEITFIIPLKSLSFPIGY